MSSLFCCVRLGWNMGAALSQPQDGDNCDVLEPSPPTMADVIRERKKKAGNPGLGTLRRRIAAAARRPRDARPDRENEHARHIRSIVSNWKLAEVMVLYEKMSLAAELKDLTTQAELAREPAPALRSTLPTLLHTRWWCDVELVGSGWCIAAHRAILAARSSHFRHALIHATGPPWRIPVSLSREATVAVLNAIYSGHCHKWDQSGSADEDLDIINNESNSRCICAGGALGTLLSRVGVRPDTLLRDLAYLLHSGEFADTRLTFEGGSEADAVPCHRVILAAGSRYFRSVVSRGGCRSSQSICVDERVLPRRLLPALLHTLYTEQVDLSLIERPASPRASSSGQNSWTSNRTKTTSSAMLEDAFQFYEIARFLEMPMAVQGCEDAIVSSLSPETLGRVLAWCSHTHASVWVNRQAMRYFREDFCSILNTISSSATLVQQLPSSCILEAVRSCLTQASEPQLLRALMRWATALAAAENKSTWQSSGRSSREAESVRALLSPLLPHVRTEHIPPTHDVMQQAIRRGLISPTTAAPSVDAWLARGLYRPPRCLTVYLEELKALLENQSVPEADLARVRRARCSRIPDTLYMVSSRHGAAPPPPAAPAPLLSALPPGAARALLRRAAELRGGRPRGGGTTRNHLIALRAVREVSLPDACADLLIPELEKMELDVVECTTPDAVSINDDPPAWDPCPTSDNNRPIDVHSAQSSHHSTLESVRRRELPAVVSEGQVQRSGSGGRLWRCVPDVALAPNGNTHLLPAPVYRLARESGSMGAMQLDLGDGATHTPRPGSRAQRAARSRDLSVPFCGSRRRPDADELRSAIEMSLMRAYSQYGSESGSGGVRGTRGGRYNTPAASSALLTGGGMSPRQSPRPHRSSLSVNDGIDSPRHSYQHYRLDPSFGGSTSSSRGPSPHDYA